MANQIIAKGNMTQVRFSKLPCYLSQGLCASKKDISEKQSIVHRENEFYF